MIRHTVIFRCRPQVTEKEIVSAIDAAKVILPGVPGVASLTVGRDKGLQPGKSGDFAIVADFASTEAVVKYLNHPVHLDFVKDVLSPIVESRISVQFES